MKSLYGKLQKSMVFLMKLCVASFFRLISKVYGNKLN